MLKQKNAEEKWNQKLEEATQVAEDEKENKVKKMLGLVSKELAELKKACKKASDVKWGASELQNLSRCREELEDLSCDCELQGIQNKLLQAATALKASRQLMKAKA